MIWCVEDDAGIREIELYALNSTGLGARGFEDGAAFWEALQTETPELVLLDVMLPGEDGVSLLRRMKASPNFRDIPVIMATARGAEYDKIQSLDLGADDYLVKPFGVMEMVSRVKAVLRRCRPQETGHVLSAGGISLDPERRTVTVEGQRVQLTYKEFELLRLFLSRPGMAFTREQLYTQVWDRPTWWTAARWICTSVRSAKSWVIAGGSLKRCGMWATGWRRPHDRKNLPLRAGRVLDGAAGSAAGVLRLPVWVFRLRVGAAAPGGAAPRGLCGGDRGR